MYPREKRMAFWLLVQYVGLIMLIVAYSLGAFHQGIVIPMWLFIYSGTKLVLQSESPYRESSICAWIAWAVLMGGAIYLKHCGR